VRACLGKDSSLVAIAANTMRNKCGIWLEIQNGNDVHLRDSSRVYVISTASFKRKSNMSKKEPG